MRQEPSRTTSKYIKYKSLSYKSAIVKDCDNFGRKYMHGSIFDRQFPKEPDKTEGTTQH